MMYEIVSCWIFIVGLFASSYSYTKMMFINTDNGYCEYFNGLLIPVNDYAFDVEKCETIYCQPGKIEIHGCYPVFFIPPHANLSCRLVRGEDIFDCCATTPKCKVIGQLPRNFSYPKHWIIEEDGNHTMVSLNKDTSEKDEYKKYSTEEDDYEEDSPAEVELKIYTTEEYTAEEDEYEKDATEEDSIKENTAGKTLDPLLSEINRFARNYPIS